MINKLFAFYPENTCNTLSFMKQDFKDKVQLCKKKKKKAQNTIQAEKNHLIQNTFNIN